MEAAVEGIFVLAADQALAAGEDAGPDAAADQEENYQRDDGDGDDRRAQPACVAPAVDAIINFAVDRANAFLVVVWRLVRELLCID